MDSVRDPGGLATAGAQLATDYQKQLLQVIQMHADNMKLMEERHNHQMDAMQKLLAESEKRSTDIAEQLTKSLLNHKEQYKLLLDSAGEKNPKQAKGKKVMPR